MGKKERCRVCGKKVRMQIQKNTGYCCAKHQEEGESEPDQEGSRRSG